MSTRILIADDHAGYVLGADGYRQAETPNLDRLASEGTRFASHYCNSPVCTPSRQSLLTGLLPHAAGVTQLSTRLSESKATLAKQFLKAGYTTAVFGKMHFNQSGQNWLAGDFNGDGKVNALDFNAIATNYGQTLPAPGLGLAVPEPMSIVLLGLPLLLRRYRRGFQ